MQARSLVTKKKKQIKVLFMHEIQKFSTFNILRNYEYSDFYISLCVLGKAQKSTRQTFKVPPPSEFSL